MTVPKQAKVLIVGAGVAGGIVARELLDAGHDGVLMVETGGKPKARDRRLWLDHLVDRATDHYPELRFGDDDDIADLGPHYYPAGSLRGMGGTASHWLGYTPRFQPEDFELHSRTGHGVDWPLSYGDIEPFYAEAEKTLQVCGDASEVGHPKRSGEFPMPAFPFQHSDAPFMKAMTSLGYGFQKTAISRNTVAVNGHAQCQNIGTCGYCPIGARFMGEQLIETLIERSGFQLSLGVSVTKILFDSKKKARGAELLDHATKETVVVEADHVLIAGGGVLSPKLMLQSKSSHWPDGIGNHHDNVGRYLHSHFIVPTIGSVPNPERWYRETGDLATLSTRHFDSPTYQAEGKFSAGMFHWRNVPMGSEKDDVVDKMLAGKSVSQIKAELDEFTFCVVMAEVEEVPRRENRVTIVGGEDRYGSPRCGVDYRRDERAYQSAKACKEHSAGILTEMGCTLPGPLGPVIAGNTVHHSGTCRMAKNAEDGVVDPNLRVFGTENVHVCSSAVFPTAGASQVTLTIAAFAHRLGKHLAATI